MNCAEVSSNSTLNLTNEDCPGVDQSHKESKGEMEKISELLHALIELQTKSAKIETAIRQQGREIKLDIFPDGYDKRTAPPRINGKTLCYQVKSTNEYLIIYIKVIRLADMLHKN